MINKQFQQDQSFKKMEIPISNYSSDINIYNDIPTKDNNISRTNQKKNLNKDFNFNS